MATSARRWLAGSAAGTLGLAAALGFSRDTDALRVKPSILDTAAVLVTARTAGGQCPTFRTGELHALVDRVKLERNYVSSCPPHSLTVFGVDRAVMVGEPETTWSDAIQELRVTALPPPLTIELQVWDATGRDSVLDGIVDADIREANDVFRRRRAGIVLERKPGIKVFRPHQPYAIKHDCDSVDSILGFEPDPARLNVVYLEGFVDSDDGSPSTARGYACPRHQRPSPVVFLSRKNANDLTLAHEIVHVLGHSSEEFKKSGGAHTDERGFPSNNLMSRTAGSGHDPRTGFSLGQIFRVHLDSRSWVNRAKLRGGAFALTCKDEDPTGVLIDSLTVDGLDPCPRLITGVELF
jgi:hypothetical protein